MSKKIRKAENIFGEEINRFSLKFCNNHLEREFTDYYCAKYIWQLRIAHLIAIGLYLFAITSEIIFFDIPISFYFFRLLIVIPSFILGYLITFLYKDIYIKYYKYIDVYYVLLTGISFIIAGFYVEEPYKFIVNSGLFICLIFNYTAIRQDFIKASLTGLFLLLAYIAFSISNDSMLESTIHISMYFFAANILGMYISYSTEYESKKSYLMIKKIEADKNELNMHKENLELRIKDRTKELLEEKEKTEKNKIELDEIKQTYDYATHIGKVGTWDWNLLNNELRWNDVTYLILGYTPGSVKPSYELFLSMIHNDDREYLDSKVQESWKNKTPYNVDCRIVLSENKIIHCNATGKVYYDENNKPVRMIGTFQDITDRKKIETELTLAKEKAEESDRLKTAFLQNMSHEIRTPMNGILGFTGLLKDDDLSNDEKNEFIEMIENSGKRMMGLLDDIINISKIETGDLEVNRTYFRLIDQLEILYDMFDEPTKDKSLELTVDYPFKHANIEVHSDLSKFNMIFSKLLNNAVKFTNEGRVSFGYEINNNELTFFVSDTGIGIPEHLQGKIFERFSQVDSSITRGYEGSGLGLSLAKSLVEILGGKIWVDSEEGKGSTFFFTLPDMIKSYEEIEIYMNKSDENEEMYNSILVAEDDDVSFQLLERFLKNRFKQIYRASTGKEAVEMALEYDDIEVILMDLKMPQMDGLTATREIRKFNKDIPIFAQTAYAFYKDHQDALEAGCNYCIAKPYDRNELLSLIRKCLK
jgi:signal transduction histidine kinase